MARILNVIVEAPPLVSHRKTGHSTYTTKSDKNPDINIISKQVEKKMQMNISTNMRHTYFQQRAAEAKSNLQDSPAKFRPMLMASRPLINPGSQATGESEHRNWTL